MKEYRLGYDAQGSLLISDAEGLLGFVITAKALAQGIAEKEMAENLKALDEAVRKLQVKPPPRRTLQMRKRR
jgi:hypothetical protein